MLQQKRVQLIGYSKGKQVVGGRQREQASGANAVLVAAADVGNRLDIRVVEHNQGWYGDLAEPRLGRGLFDFLLVAQEPVCLVENNRGDRIVGAPCPAGSNDIGPHSRRISNARPEPSRRSHTASRSS